MPPTEALKRPLPILELHADSTQAIPKGVLEIVNADRTKASRTRLPQREVPKTRRLERSEVLNLSRG